MARRILWASLALAPVTIALGQLVDVNKTVMFILAGAALIPLAWLIGEATENAAEHTGAGVGGFLNASFGNAPELIIALIAINDGLPQVVRGSLAGSVISNLLLVFGLTQIVGPNKSDLDRRSLLTQLGLCAVAVLAFHDPGAARFTPATRSVTAVARVDSRRRAAPTLPHHATCATSAAIARRNEVPAWRLRCPVSRSRCSASPPATAFVSEILVHSLMRSRRRSARVSSSSQS